jgi:hypothetical protein
LNSKENWAEKLSPNRKPLQNFFQLIFFNFCRGMQKPPVNKNIHILSKIFNKYSIPAVMRGGAYQFQAEYRKIHPPSNYPEENQTIQAACKGAN